MQRYVPGPLWVSICLLGLLVILHLVQGLTTGSAALLFSAAIEVILLVGLVRCRKWAYILVLVFAVLGVVAVMANNMTDGIAILVGNAMVVAPMMVCTKFFFPKQAPSP